ncbi:MAG: hypothetical protein P4L76_14365 [Beijerinckiaceae bacterium]|nr:hypothetical protein [Beijerinckiaceae bacterium]
MSLSTISSAATSPAIAVSALYKQANGEYSAGDVASDYAAASKLGLVKLPDGNYGSLLSAIFATSPAAASSSPGIQSALNSLVLGG